MPDYSHSNDSKEAEKKRVSETIPSTIHNEFNDPFSVIGFFEVLFLYK